MSNNLPSSISSFEAQFGMAKITVADYGAVAGERLEMPYQPVLGYKTKKSKGVKGVKDVKDVKDVRDVVERMRKLARVVSDGKSVAVATWFEGAEYQERDPRKLAAMSSTPQELEQYDAWSAGGLCLPEFNWSMNVDDSPMSTSIVKSMQDRADAMNILWKTNKAKPHHALWLSDNWIVIVPLVSAVILVEKAKKDLKCGSQCFTADEMAEIQTIDKAFDQVTQFFSLLNSRKAEYSEVTTRDVEYSMQILLARKLAIEKNAQERMAECSVIKTEASIPAGIESRHNRKEVS
ncbi:hypothetical protein EMCG_09331 [[Emmonsia] crescens]|uniref:Uncharacterized protein n=1 Tax=[Emmonsia] crescens TaxID=73230 RepID=A0A0G2I3H7_9EURO|nr:hypothetical protein EMCG_09331 [Emmonsia crescens UAMH 3008]